MNCLSWRGIFHGSWEKKSKFQMGGLRETGGLPLFSPEGRTYSPPRRHKLHILRPAASGRSHPFRCASFSHKVNDFVGALLRRWYACGIVRSPRGIAAVATASRQCHSTCGCRCHRLRDWRNTAASTTAIFQPPAQTCHRQLCRRDGRAFSPSIFSFAKEKQKKETR